MRTSLHAIPAFWQPALLMERSAAAIQEPAFVAKCASRLAQALSLLRYHDIYGRRSYVIRWVTYHNIMAALPHVAYHPRGHMLPSYHYSYLVGVLIFWVAWIVCSILGKRYRAEIRWGSLIAAPMALTSLLFVPQYWSPPSLFNLDQRIRVGIEDVLWAAAVGGIASVVGEMFLREGLAAMRKLERKRHYAPFTLAVVVFSLLSFGVRARRWT